MPPLRDHAERAPAPPPLQSWVRGMLAGTAVGLTLVFAVAWWLDPYQPDGTPRQMATHRQLGLPPCTFWTVTGLPCPTCGMTTSFALLVRGDVANSLRANSVGTGLAILGLLMIPWSLAGVVWNRTPFVRSLERSATWIVLVFLGLALLRWLVVVLVFWPTGKPTFF